MSSKLQSFRGTSAALFFVTVALSACSSKNPDALTGMNLDENAAMMDANASVDANFDETNATSANSSAVNSTSKTQADQQSANASAPKPTEPSRSSRSAEVNAARNSSTQLNDIQNSPIPDQPDEPNVTSNDID